MIKINNNLSISDKLDKDGDMLFLTEINGIPSGFYVHFSDLKKIQGNIEKVLANLKS